jgi:hypothetical protein
METYTVKYFSNDSAGRVFRSEEVEGTELIAAIAIGARDIRQQGARITWESTFDVESADGRVERIPATSIRHWLRKNPEGQALVERENLHGLLEDLKG